jgi:hypothetical protein
MERELRALRRNQEALTKPLTIEDRNAIAAAHTRADSLYQMLGEQAPQHYPGDSPIAFRRRLADGLRKFDKNKWANYVIHDSLDSHAFELIENAIYDAARAAAKNPEIVGANQLRAIHDMSLGKPRVRWVGDARAAWTPFMPPTRRLIVGFTREPNRGVSR